MPKKSTTKVICPLCPSIIYRKDVGKHLRVKHGENDVNPLVCPWPDCGQPYTEKKPLQSHLYSHTDPKARRCTLPKKAKNGQWVTCRFILLDQCKTATHQWHVHGVVKAPNGSIGHPASSSRNLENFTGASNFEGDHDTRGGTDSLQEINLDGLLQIQPEEDDLDFPSSSAHLSAVTPIDQPEKTGGTIPKHEAIVPLDTPPVVVSSSKPLTRQDVRHSKGVNLEDSDRLTTRQMSSIKAKAGVSKPMVAP